MAKKRKNGAELKEKRRIKLEKQKKTTDMIAYIIAGVAVVGMIALIVIALI